MSAKLYASSSERVAAFREKQRMNGNTVELPKVPVQLPHMETFLEKAFRLEIMDKKIQDPILDGVFIPNAINILYAHSGIGKSSLMLYLAEKWAEMPCTNESEPYKLLSLDSCRKKRKVVFVDYELGDEDFLLKDLRNNVFHVEKPSLEQLVLIMDELQPDIIIIDNLSFLIKNLNDFKEVTKIMSFFKKYESRMTIILIGHTPKESNSLYGSVQQQNVTSSMVYMTTYKEYYVLYVSKYRRQRIFDVDNAIVLSRDQGKFEFKGIVNYEILKYGVDELKSDYNTVMLSLERNSVLQTCKNYNLQRKDVAIIKKLGSILNQNIVSYWFLDEPQNQENNESEPNLAF